MNARPLVVAMVASIATLAVAMACSSSGAGGGPSDDGGATLDAPDLCSTFTDAGDPCRTASSRPCFPMCATGGCFCAAGPAGPRWTCTTDFSCFPDGSPLEDAPGGDDASTFDAGGAEGGVDGGADGGADAGPVEASTLDATDAGDGAD